MPFACAVLLILLLIAGIIALIWWAIVIRNAAPWVGGIVLFAILVYLTAWTCKCYNMPEEIATEEYYTPVMLTDEIGNKIQFIYAHNDVVNVTTTFGAIVPEDKVIKRVTWKSNYGGMSFDKKPTKFFIVPKEEKK